MSYFLILEKKNVRLSTEVSQRGEMRKLRSYGRYKYNKVFN